jgi:acetyltransferase-like isoleucine patch superfamily enzyme
MLTEKPRFPLREIILYGWLPSRLKKIILRLMGYRIGRGVSIGFGSVICGRNVEIGDHTRIGFFSFIRGTTIRLGAHVQIGATVMLDTPHIEIGDGTRINEQVFVGGLQFPDSKLVIGRNCQIMQMSFINPARSITIGDDTGIGGHCLLFGHTSWLSKFEGYPVDFQSIEIGNSASIAWRVFVLPGTRIGDGAVIGANSLVKGTIPPRCLAVGFPARVVSMAPEFPREVTEAEKEGFLKEILTEMMGYFHGSGLTCHANKSTYEITEQRRRGWRMGRKTWRLAVDFDSVAPGVSERLAGKADVFLSLRRIPAAVRKDLAQRKLMWIDIESKERPKWGNDLGEEVVHYLRRYGVRFFRVAE